MAYTEKMMTPGTSVLTRFMDAFSALRQKYAQIRLYRKSVSELSALSDRELADIGLHRSGIRETAYSSTFFPAQRPENIRLGW